jgi:hypothetical protein
MERHDDVHKRISALGATLEKLVLTFKIDETLHFAATRRHIRDFSMSTPKALSLTTS